MRIEKHVYSGVAVDGTMAGRTVGCCFCAFPTYQGVDLHCLEQRIFLSIRHLKVGGIRRGEGAAGMLSLGVRRCQEAEFGLSDSAKIHAAA